MKRSEWCCLAGDTCLCCCVITGLIRVVFFGIVVCIWAIPGLWDAGSSWPVQGDRVIHLGVSRCPGFSKFRGLARVQQLMQLPWGLRVEFPPLFLSGRSNPSPCHVNCEWLSTSTVLLWGKGEEWIFIQCLLYGRNCSALRNFINGIKWLSPLYVGCHIAIEW